MHISILATSWATKMSALFPGIAVSVVIAITAAFLSEHYGVPAMLMALLLGMVLNFLSEENTRTAWGIDVTAKSVLRFGVALLGARISVDILVQMGAAAILITIAGVTLTIGFALLLGRLFGWNWKFAFLTGGAVAICGASAAMAIAAILPKHDNSERNLIFTVLAVTILSTMAMIAYPILAQGLDLDVYQSGLFLGGTIHDVAQVVGAGFSVSPETGEVATLVKLIRVSMLAPVVLCASLIIRQMPGTTDSQGKRPPIVPHFVMGFLILAGLNSFDLVPTEVANLARVTSKWALLTAVAAVGAKTSLGKMLQVGPGAFALVLAETLFLGCFILVSLLLLG